MAALTIKVEKGIPVPLGDGRGAPNKYPFGKMEVGDSFALPVETPSRATTIRRAAHMWGKRCDMRFTARSRVEDGVKIVRVWRVA